MSDQITPTDAPTTDMPQPGNIPIGFALFVAFIADIPGQGPVFDTCVIDSTVRGEHMTEQNMAFILNVIQNQVGTECKICILSIITTIRTGSTESVRNA